MDGHRHVEHEIVVDAPAPEIYRLLAEVENWPRLFPPSVHVEYLEREQGSERIRTWAVTGGMPTTWTSRRELDADALRIDFRRERSCPPVAAMDGTWIVEPSGAGRSRVRLLHDYRSVDDDPAGLAWIGEAVDHNARAELAALRRAAEVLAGDGPDLFVSVVDTLEIHGSAKNAFDVVDDAAAWEQRLPDVARAVLTEDTPGLQTLEMDTRGHDGSTHTTTSVRVTFPHERIAYRNTRVAPLMATRTGLWTFTETDGVTVAGSRHEAMIDESAIASVLGPHATPADAREHVRTVLGATSRATLGLAKEHAEALA